MFLVKWLQSMANLSVVQEHGKSNCFNIVIVPATR